MQFRQEHIHLYLVKKLSLNEQWVADRLAALVNTRDAEQRTAMYYACLVGNEAMFRMLVETGADISCSSLKDGDSEPFESSCWHALALSETEG